MWKRIHSNRHPKDTLYSELRKEFGSYFFLILKFWLKCLARYPKFFFTAMVLLILVSIGLSFTVPRQQEPEKKPNSPATHTLTDGFGQIVLATGKIRETLRLKQMIDSISAKKQLTGADSIFLDSALNKVQHNH